MTEKEEAKTSASASRWQSLGWPRWLPIGARPPLVAQIAGVAALVAAIAMPAWPELFPGPPASTPRVPSQGVAVAPAADAVPAKGAPSESGVRPAHLNLEVRHNFSSIDLAVSIDGKRALDTRIAGSRKRFGAFGKREERAFTRTLDLAPGTRIVHVRVRSTQDKFEQTRVERFDLASASVASMRIVAEKSGLSIVADKPSLPQSAEGARPSVAASAPPAAAAQAAPSAAAATEASVLSELYQTMRSMLIAIAGFVASAATGFMVQEYLRSRRAPSD